MWLSKYRVAKAKNRKVEEREAREAGQRQQRREDLSRRKRGFILIFFKKQNKANIIKDAGEKCWMACILATSKLLLTMTG